MEPGLAVVCLTAFAVVFLVLAVLAAAMRTITIAFPERAGLDAATVAAVSGAVAALVPGARITSIEEE